MGGDYYDFIEINENKCGIAIADVSGKGTAAAIVMPTIEVALRMEALNGQDMAKGFRNLNKVICEVTENARFVTLFYGQLKISDRTLEYINAGHIPPLRYRQKDQKPYWLEAIGPPVGLFDGSDYTTKTIQFEAYDVLVLYTDGLSEAEDTQGDQFSREAIARITMKNASKCAQEIFDSLMNGVNEFRSNKQFDDDMTLIVVKFAN
jgi:sigma-B regulation protein RsbU (phosphoserine phosphatase)